jgi:hypothetical protein
MKTRMSLIAVGAIRFAIVAIQPIPEAMAASPAALQIGTWSCGIVDTDAISHIGGFDTTPHEWSCGAVSQFPIPFAGLPNKIVVMGEVYFRAANPPVAGCPHTAMAVALVPDNIHLQYSSSTFLVALKQTPDRAGITGCATGTWIAVGQ